MGRPSNALRRKTSLLASWTSTALDLTLDAEIRRWNKIGGPGQFTPIRPMLPEFNTDELIARFKD